MRVNMAGPGNVGPIGPRPSRVPILPINPTNQIIETVNNDNQDSFTYGLDYMELFKWVFFFTFSIGILLILT